MALNTTAFDKLFKDVYAAQIESALNEEFPLFERVKKYKGKPTGGRKFVFPTKMKRTSSVHFITDGGNFPTATSPEWADGEVTCAYQAGLIEVTGPAIAASNGDKKAFAEAMSESRKDLTDQIKNRTSKAMMGSKTGIQAQVNAVNGLDITVDAMDLTTGYGTFMLESGDMIAVVNGGTGAIRGTATIATVVHSTHTFTVDAVPVGTADNDYIVYATSATEHDYNRAITGFGDLFAASSSYMNLDPATYPKWVPSVIAAGGQSLSMDLLDQLMLTVQAKSGKTAQLICANSGMATDVRNLFQDQVRYTGKEMKGGMKSASYDILGNEVTFLFDRFFLPGRLYMLNEDELNWFVMKEGGFDSMYGGSVVKWTGRDSGQAVWTKYFNFGTVNRQAHGVMTGITQGLNIYPTM